MHSHSAKLHWTDAHLGWDTLPETIQLHINVGGWPKQKDCVCGFQVTSACGQSA